MLCIVLSSKLRDKVVIQASSNYVSVWCDKCLTYSSSQYLQSSKAHIQRNVGWGVINKDWDGDEAKVYQEGENVEHKQPLEEHEIGKDAGAKCATYLFHDALP